MNKADKLGITIVFLCICLLYLPLLWNVYISNGKEKVVVVNYKDEEVLRVPLHKDDTYRVNGTLGKVEIEVLNNKVRVEKETSSYHLCSIQGWVEHVNQPIVCLPNHIVVQIQSNMEDEESNDVVIQ